MTYYIVSRRRWFRKEYDCWYNATTRHRKFAFRFASLSMAAQGIAEWRNAYKFGWDIEEIVC